METTKKGRGRGFQIKREKHAEALLQNFRSKRSCHSKRKKSKARRTASEEEGRGAGFTKENGGTNKKNAYRESKRMEE